MKKLTIYTDGSHLKHTTGRLGIGGVLVDENGDKLDEFSKEINTDYLRDLLGTVDVSNPTCELLANLFALEQFEEYLKDCSEVYMVADYEGVQKFNLKQWKARLPYIKKIVDLTEQEVKKQKLEKRLKYRWVKGHQRSILDIDGMWNDYVDKLAKGQVTND
jgi:ribonuclease HI